MRHLHQRIVHHNGKVVGRAAVGSHQDRIADHVGAERDFAADEILECDVDVLGNAEADDRALATLEPLARLVWRNRPAGAGVARRTAGGEHGAAVRLELLRGAEAIVGMPAGEQLVCVRRIEMQPLRLPVRSITAADVWSLVPLEAEPAEIVEDALLRRLRRALRVGILDAQDERAVVTPREQPVEERRTRIADVKLPGRTRGKTDSHEVMCSGCVRWSRATAWAAIASPRPTASTPSFVLPLMLMQVRSIPIAAARRDRMSSI